MIEDFVAFDFETASGKNPCSLGMVEYKNGKKYREFYELINPEVAYFNPFAVQIHGIRYEDVQHEKNFAERWEEMSSFIEGKTLVAHNAKFDNSVLLYSLQRYGIELPQFNSFCTLQRARKLVRLPSYKLSSLANFFEVPQFHHHNALEDAFVCGELFLKLNRLEQELQLQQEHGVEFPSSYLDWIAEKQGQNVQIRRKALASFSQLFGGLRFVISGNFQNFSRTEMQKIITQNGGRVTGSVSGLTNYLVCGTEPGQAKLGKARSTGTRVLSENDFLKILRVL
ncbi:exonuclease domain-containing protein [Zunongwangia atlantica]|uniref:DNA polymerase III subunit epsilon n=1 Tax=Zunongwangia atlantica 22II14-10F7 TaxID=1185767 RepID=A0A1Y1T0U6_9FLAO|nr:exonuclease domain-containing protein [Zunongwangia atlantica]ORL44224.1 DNA polymerase III subunit epsilon [Zunongwangia atlantica 22II14-10F7]